MITLGHGAGGRLSHELVKNHFLKHFRSKELSALEDAAVLGDVALTTDGYVVSPRFFPGGDIGRLSVCGTVNDLAMVGATPLGLTAGFMIEEGFALEELDRIIQSAALAAEEAGVEIVAGDTKVVPRGALDGLFITTAGYGRLEPDFRPSPSRVKAGDLVLVNGNIGDHGMAVMTCREGLPLKGKLESDVAPLNDLVAELRQNGIDVHALRDPTRGGVAQSLIEICGASRTRIVLEEAALPINKSVIVASEILGIDPLYVANEGKLLAIVPAEEGERALDIMKQHPRGVAAAIIGKVEKTDRPGLEVLTSIGARRSLRMPAGELLPRIC